MLNNCISHKFFKYIIAGKKNCLIDYVKHCVLEDFKVSEYTYSLLEKCI